MIRRDDMDSELQRRVEEFARESGVRPDDVVRSALEEYFAVRPVAEAGSSTSHESLFDRWSRLGVIGCIQGDAASPRDLSTNPQHLEGFGND